MGEPTVELVYFDGCPNADRAREQLRAAMGESGWKEWNLSSSGVPPGLRRFGSPTVLVNGRDVTGEDGGNAAMACRADGVPGAELIRKAVDASG